MRKVRAVRTTPRTPAEVKRDQAVREKFQKERPTLETLTKSGEWGPAMKQGEYLSLMQLAAAIKLHREQLHLSLTDVADKSGIDKAAISRFENGLVDNPTINTLQRLARSVGKRLRFELEDDVAAESR